MTIRIEVYNKAEEHYYYYINELNGDNPSYKKPTLKEFKKRLTLNNPSTLAHFHTWLTEYRAQRIAEGLGYSTYKEV